MVFRPQDATIIADGAVAGPDNAAVSGIVAYREFLGASVRYGVRTGTASIAVDSPFHAGDMLHEVGASVTVAVAIGSVRWLSD